VGAAMTGDEFDRQQTAVLERFMRWCRDTLDLAAICEEHGYDDPGLRARFEQACAEREAIADAASSLLADFLAAQQRNFPTHRSIRSTRWTTSFAARSTRSPPK
jgi:hypothetical protein